jgi:cytochrome c oxidase assembly protein subunit 15
MRTVMSDPSAPILWQFSLSTINAIVWVVLLLLGLTLGLRMRWGRLVALTAFLTLDLIAFGAFVRLTDSGLGCPDWPGCYGQLLPAQASVQINQAMAEQGGAHGPVSHVKAWIEMLHRSVASFIGMLILVMFVRALIGRLRGAGGSWLRSSSEFGAASVGLAWPLLLLIVVSLQGLFGKWTVTLKLMPIVVTTHLMGGMLLFALLIWFWMRERVRAGDARAMSVAVSGRVRMLVWLAVVTLALQIFLGGWVSTNYAVLACGDFPGCNTAGQLMPGVAWNEGFTLFRALGRNPDGSFLSIEGLRAIHWAHRLGALVTTLVVIAAAVSLLRAHPSLRRQAFLIKSVLLLQVLIGISTVLFAQPILLATAHNFVAAVLMASLVVAAFRVGRSDVNAGFAVSTTLRNRNS